MMNVHTQQHLQVMSLPDFDDHEQVVFCSDQNSGLRAIIAIHSTRLGPALGGCRMWAYPTEAHAVTDVLRLSRGMTFKAAMAGLDLGGGKSVIIGNPHKDKSPRLLEAMGRAVERLSGRYITAEDVGTTVEDMSHVKQGTSHVVGLGTEEGGTGDPSPTTAKGTLVALKAAVAHAHGTANLHGARVALQGLGNVGWHLASYLRDEGADLVVSDVVPERLERAVVELSATVVEPDAIYEQLADVFAPCALGAILNDDTIPKLKAKVVAGGANNQCARPEHADQLQDRGILLAPDYIANAAGLIRVDSERRGFDAEWVDRKVSAIAETLEEVFRAAETWEVSTLEAAERLAKRRLIVH